MKKSRISPTPPLGFLNPFKWFLPNPGREQTHTGENMTRLAEVTKRFCGGGLPLNDIPHWFQSSALASLQRPVFHLGSLSLAHRKTSGLPSFLPPPTVLFCSTNPQTLRHAHHPPAPLPMTVCFCRAATVCV